MPGGARRQLTFFPDRVGGASFGRASAGDYFVFAKDRGGDEFFQIYRYDVADRRGHAADRRRRRATRSAPWSHSGDRLAYGSTRRNGKDRDIYVMDPRDPKATGCVARGRGRRLGAARLVARRQRGCSCRIYLGQRELPVAGGRRERREDAR